MITNEPKRERETKIEPKSLQFSEESIDYLQKVKDTTNEKNSCETDYAQELILRHILQGHKALINKITWSSDGNKLASVSEDGTVRIWNIEKGECILEDKKCKEGVISIEWSPNGKMLAFADKDNLIKLWVDESDRYAPEAYEDFDLHIAEGHVTARVFQSEATANISKEASNDILFRLDNIKDNNTTETSIDHFGKALYSWMFPYPIDTLFTRAEGIAEGKKLKLRLRLRIEDHGIASLPLEFLKKGHHFLAANPNIALCRYLNFSEPPNKIKSQVSPLHMLVIIADPNDQKARLNPETWENLIRNALIEASANNRITFDFVTSATTENIYSAINKKMPNIIQFIGHGVYKNNIGHLALVNGINGGINLVDDEEFAKIFLDAKEHLGLINLATCESATSDDPQGFLGIAPRLVKRGFPAVIAMQYKVHVETIKIFLNDFYRSIAERKPVDLATQLAREAILQSGLYSCEFATPVLYMRANNGDIFSEKLD
jgi:WD40 repeat protein